MKEAVYEKDFGAFKSLVGLSALNRTDRKLVKFIEWLLSNIDPYFVQNLLLRSPTPGLDRLVARIRKKLADPLYATFNSLKTHFKHGELEEFNSILDKTILNEKADLTSEFLQFLAESEFNPEAKYKRGKEFLNAILSSDANCENAELIETVYEIRALYAAGYSVELVPLDSAPLPTIPSNLEPSFESVRIILAHARLSEFQELCSRFEFPFEWNSQGLLQRLTLIEAAPDLAGVFLNVCLAKKFASQCLLAIINSPKNQDNMRLLEYIRDERIRCAVYRI
jgi:hypothetical protein